MRTPLRSPRPGPRSGVAAFMAAALVAAASAAEARWAEISEAEAVIESSVTEIDVNADGTHRIVSETLMEVRNEQGRNAIGTTQLTYDSESVRFRILKAATVNGRKSVPVPKTLIEDKPLASPETGFDRQNQVTVAYPDVEPGSRLLLKTREDVHRVPMPGIFSELVTYGEDYPETAGRLVIRSALPLRYTVSDPRGCLKVEAGPQPVRKLTVTLTCPVYTQVRDESSGPRADDVESEGALVAAEDRTYVAVSSMADPAPMVRSVAAAYEAVMNAALPADFAAILESARRETAPAARLDAVTSRLAEQVRYMGDWRTVRGGHVPRPMELVAATRFGDCKDFAAVTAAILRRLGFGAHVAWVTRGRLPPFESPVPMDGDYNHAIVRVSQADGTVQWIDPTNLVSYGRGIFDDIKDRPALVIDARAPRVERIPLPPPEAAQIRMETVMQPESDLDGVMTVAMVAEGGAAVAWTGYGLLSSGESIDEYLVRYFAGGEFVRWSKVRTSDLKSRLVDRIRFDVTMGLKNFAMRTTAGAAWQLDRGALETLIDVDRAKRMSAVYLGQPQVVETTERLKDAVMVGLAPAPCHIRSRWFELEREIAQDGRDILVRSRYVVLQPAIPAAEVRAEGFAPVQAALQACYPRQAIVFTPSPAGS